MNANFEKLAQREGGYSLPYLVHLYDKNGTDLYFINDVKDCTFENNVYKASAFQYSPNQDDHGFDGGGKLNISLEDSVTEIVLKNYDVYLDVTGILYEDGTVTPLNTFKHHYGEVSCSGNQIQFTFDADDRLSMTFPGATFNSENNKGNY